MICICTWEFKYKLHLKKVSVEKPNDEENAEQGKRTTQHAKTDGLNRGGDGEAMKAAAMV